MRTQALQFHDHSPSVTAEAAARYAQWPDDVFRNELRTLAAMEAAALRGLATLALDTSADGFNARRLKDELRHARIQLTTAAYESGKRSSHLLDLGVPAGERNHDTKGYLMRQLECATDWLLESYAAFGDGSDDGLREMLMAEVAGDFHSGISALKSLWAASDRVGGTARQITEHRSAQWELHHLGGRDLDTPVWNIKAVRRITGAVTPVAHFLKIDGPKRLADVRVAAASRFAATGNYPRQISVQALARSWQLAANPEAKPGRVGSPATLLSSAAPTQLPALTPLTFAAEIANAHRLMPDGSEFVDPGRDGGYTTLGLGIVVRAVAAATDVEVLRHRALAVVNVAPVYLQSTLLAGIVNEHQRLVDEVLPSLQTLYRELAAPGLRDREVIVQARRSLDRIVGDVSDSSDARTIAQECIGPIEAAVMQSVARTSGVVEPTLSSLAL